MFLAEPNGMEPHFVQAVALTNIRKLSIQSDWTQKVALGPFINWHTCRTSGCNGTSLRSAPEPHRSISVAWFRKSFLCVSHAFETMMVFSLWEAFLFFAFSDFKDKKKGIRFSGGSPFQGFSVL